MSNSSVRLLLAAVGALGMVFGAFSLAPAQEGRPRGAPYAPTRWEWTREAWTAEDRSYRALREAIDAAIAAGKSPEAIRVGHQTRAEKRPYDPLAQFGWAYATYRAAARNSRLPRGLVLDALAALASVPTPNSYEYARLRFLFEGSATPKMPLLPVGKRLLAKRPHDPEVKYILRILLS